MQLKNYQLARFEKQTRRSDSKCTRTDSQKENRPAQHKLQSAIAKATVKGEPPKRKTWAENTANRNKSALWALGTKNTPPNPRVPPIKLSRGLSPSVKMMHPLFKNSPSEALTASSQAASELISPSYSPNTLQEEEEPRVLQRS